MTRFTWTDRAARTWEAEQLRHARELHRRPIQVRWIPQHVLDRPVPTLADLENGVDLTGYIRFVTVGA